MPNPRGDPAGGGAQRGQWMLPQRLGSAGGRRRAVGVTDCSRAGLWH